MFLPRHYNYTFVLERLDGTPVFVVELVDKTIKKALRRIYTRFYLSKAYKMYNVSMLPRTSYSLLDAPHQRIKVTRIC